MDKKKIEYLYKYRPLINYNSKDKEINKFTSDLLKEGQLHFSSPLDFNDPFDSLINIEKKYEKFLLETESVESRFNKKKNNTNWNALKGKTWRDLPNESWNNINAAYSVSDLRILCVSKTFENILMWTHYADSHKGICIGFDFYENSLKLNNNEYKFKKVKYDNSYKIDDNNSKINSLFYKFIDWEYESEYRLVLDNTIINDENQNFKIDLTYIKEIIFGILTPLKYIELLINEMYQSDYKSLIEKNNLQFFQMKRNLGTYELTKNKLDISNYLNK